MHNNRRGNFGLLDPAPGLRPIAGGRVPRAGWKTGVATVFSVWCSHFGEGEGNQGARSLQMGGEGRGLHMKVLDQGARSTEGLKLEIKCKRKVRTGCPSGSGSRAPPEGREQGSLGLRRVVKAN